MGAAHPHLRDIEVAAISNVVSFFFHGIHPFLKDLGYLSFYHPKTAEAVKGRAFNLNPSSGSAVPEGGVPGQVAGQEISGRCELLADEAQAEEPGAHGVFGVLVLLGLGACRPHILCHLAEGQAKLDVALKLPCVDAAPALGGRLIELEEPELDRAFGKGGVEVEHIFFCVHSVSVFSSLDGKQTIQLPIS